MSIKSDLTKLVDNMGKLVDWYSRYKPGHKRVLIRKKDYELLRAHKERAVPMGFNYHGERIEYRGFEVGSAE